MLKVGVSEALCRLEQSDGWCCLVIIEFAVALVTNQNYIVFYRFLDQPMKVPLGNDGSRRISRGAKEKHLTVFPIVFREVAVVR